MSKAERARQLAVGGPCARGRYHDNDDHDQERKLRAGKGREKHGGEGKVSNVGHVL